MRATHRSYRVAVIVPVLGLLFAGLVALSACSSSYGVLRFFFDGVPAPHSDREAQASDTPAPQEPIGPMPPPVAEAQMTVHRPYAEGKCDKCHASRIGKPDSISSIFQGVPMLLEPIEKLCFKCHSIEKKQYLHAPAVSGQCLFCHDPHRMPNKRMLLMSSTRDLCARCHGGSTFLTAKEHERYGDRECVDCHDPHSADYEYNLLPGAKLGEPEPRKPTVSLPHEW